MKLYLLPVLVAALLACQISADVPAFTIDRQYTYQYESRVSTGVAANIKQFAGLGIKGNVIIQNQGNYLYMKFDNILYGQFNDKVNVSMSEEFQMPYTPIVGPHTFVKEALNKPVQVVIEKGLVKYFYVHTDDPVWSVNVKRAILSLFQLNFDRVNRVRFSKSNYLKQDDDNEDFFRVMEDGIGGDCETIYEVSSHPYYKYPYERVLNVTKHRHYDHCKNRPINFFSTHQGYKCDSCKTQEPLQVTGTTEYQINGDRRFYVIEKIYNTGKYMFTPFGTNGETVISGVNQTLFLTETSTIKEAITFPEKYLTYTSLTYETTEVRNNTNEVDLEEANYYNRHFYYKYNNYKEKVGEYLEYLSQNHVVTDDLSDKKYPEKIAQLVKIFGTLNFNELKDLYKSQIDYNKETYTPEKLRKKTIYFNLLTITGTNPTIKFILYSLENNYLSSHFGAVYFNQLPLYVKDHSESLTEYFYNFTKNIDETTQTSLYKTFWLVFGSLVNHGCKHNMVHHYDTHHVRPETCKRYLKEVFNYFEKSEKDWQKVLFLKTVQNMGLPESYSYIKPIVTGEKQYNAEIRLNALYTLYSFTHELREEVLSVVVPIYNNYSESVIFRLNAFEMIVNTNPSLNGLQSIADRLHKDPSRQMVSYVYSSFKALSNSTNPCHQEIGEKTRRILQNMPKYSFGDHYAHKYLNNYFNDEYKFGGESLLVHTGSNESIVPEYVYMQQSGNLLGYNMNYFAVEFQGVGFSKLFKPLFGVDSLYTSEDPNKSLFNVFRRHPRNVDTNKKELDEIESKLNIEARKTQPIAGGLTFWLFNQQFSYNEFQEHDILTYVNDGYFSLPKALPEILENGFEFNFHKAGMFADVTYEVPTEIGFPLSLSLQYPGYISLAGKVKLDVKPGFFPEDRDFKKPTTVEVSLDLKPLVHMQGIAQVAVKTPIMNSYGFGLTHDFSVKYPLNLNAKYDTKENKFDFVYKPTQSTYEIFNMKTRPFTFIDKRTNYVTAGEEPLTKPIHFREEPHKVSHELGTATGISLKYYEEHEHQWKSSCTIYNFFTNFIMQKTVRTSGRNPLDTVYAYLRDIKSLPPSIVPVDMKVYFVPNKDQPTTEYHTTVTSEKYYKTATQNPLPKLTSETIVPADPTFRKYSAMHFTTVAKGKTERTYKFDVTYSQDYDRMLRKATFDFSRSAIPGYDDEPFKMCYQASIKLPTHDTWYSFDSNAVKKADAVASLNFGKDCTSGAKIDLTYVFERSDEEKKYDANPKLYPTYNKCTEQQKQGYNISKECHEMFYQYYNLRKFTTDIHYENLPDYFLAYVDKVKFWVRALLSSNVDHVDKTVQNPTGHIKLVTNFSMNEPKLDLHIYGPQMNIFYSDIYYSKYFGEQIPFNLRIDKNRLTMQKKYPWTKRPLCKAQNKHFYTFDSVHYTFDAPKNCYYVMAKDCSKYNKFTLLTKDVEHSSKDIMKAMKVFLLNHKIEILPLDSTSPLVVRIDDVLKTIAPHSVYLLPDLEHADQDQLLFKIVHTGSNYHIEAPTIGLRIIFNGDAILVWTHNTYRGRVCGLCGDLNGEATNEFMGPKGCVYNNNAAFGYSYIVPDQKCTVPENIDHTCVYPYALKYMGKCTLRRNKVIHNVVGISGTRESNVCFSTIPIPQCAPGCKVANGQYVKRKIGFHCLKPTDFSTQELISRSKLPTPLEIHNKSNDYHEVVEYPEMCVKA